jgi:hypothetical protein
MFEAQIDSRKLFLAMKEFAKESRKDLGEIVQKQAGIMVGHLISFTPPAASLGQSMSDRGSITSQAKKRGEASVKADIAVLFPTTRLKPEAVRGMIDNGYEWGTGRGAKKIPEYADSIADLKRIHDFSRSKSTGRVRTGIGGQNMAMTNAALRREFIKLKIKNVGILNAGWLSAAKKLKTSKRATPSWITRHGDKPGGASFRDSKSGLTITISNRMPYFPRNMDSRIQRAITYRAYGLQKALESMIERKAQKATQRMR